MDGMFLYSVDGSVFMLKQNSILVYICKALLIGNEYALTDC